MKGNEKRPRRPGPWTPPPGLLPQREYAVEKALRAQKLDQETDIGRKIGLFLGLTFGISWAGIAAAWIFGIHYGDNFFTAMVNWIMVLPALLVVILRKALGQKLDIDEMRITPHLKEHWPRYIGAYLAPALLVVVTAALYFLCFPGQFDPAGSTFVGILTDSGFDAQDAHDYLVSGVLQGLFGGALVNIVPSFCEMLGFQGYLLPKLYQGFSRRGLRACLASGAIWAAWYLPLIADGYLYGTGYPGAPVLGMAMGFLFHLALGFLLSFLTLKTGSMLPAMLTRGGISAGAATALSFTTGDTSLLVGPSVYGAFGLGVLVLLAVAGAWRLLRLEKAGKLAYKAPPQVKKPQEGKAGKK